MVTVITPTVRSEGLPLVAQSLRKQNYLEWEWLVVTDNFEKAKRASSEATVTVLQEPKKKLGDYYCLNKAWNFAYARARGDLIVNIVDWLWFPPDTLSRLWEHFVVNPKALVTTVGHQYKEIIDGKPEGMVWQDPRARSDLGTFYEVAPSEMEMCIISIPKQAIIDCGGLDEVYDTCPAVGEKEMCWRMDKLGYKFYIDQSIEYRQKQHPRLRKDWDEMYKEKTTPLFTKHMAQITEGTRPLNVNSLEKYRV